MKTKKELKRLVLERRLQDIAPRIAVGRPVRINGVFVSVPDRVFVEEEVESNNGETELELELKWHAVPYRPRAKSARHSTRRLGVRSQS